MGTELDNTAVCSVFFIRAQEALEIFLLCRHLFLAKCYKSVLTCLLKVPKTSVAVPCRTLLAQSVRLRASLRLGSHEQVHVVS